MKHTKPTYQTINRIIAYQNIRIPFIDIGRPLHAGGTGFVNINNSEQDCTAVANVLNELNCSCMFVFSMPVFGIAPFTNATDEEEFIAVCVASNKLNDAEIPYLSVHQYKECNPNCVVLFKQLMVQELTAIEQKENNGGGMNLGVLISANSIVERAKNKK